MSEFTLNGDTPPDYARPMTDFPEIVHKPETTMRRVDKLGVTYGSPFAVLGRRWINQAGFSWWNSRVGSVTVRLLDPSDNTWKNYTGLGKVIAYSAEPNLTLSNFVYRIDRLRAV